MTSTSVNKERILSIIKEYEETGKINQNLLNELEQGIEFVAKLSISRMYSDLKKTKNRAYVIINLNIVSYISDVIALVRDVDEELSDVLSNMTNFSSYRSQVEQLGKNPFGDINKFIDFINALSAFINETYRNKVLDSITNSGLEIIDEVYHVLNVELTPIYSYCESSLKEGRSIIVRYNKF